MLYGYARVSSRDQKLDRQIVALKEAGVEEKNIFIDKSTGANFKRPGYQKMLDTIQEGDLIYILSVDRLGRDYTEILEQWNYITKKLHVDMKILDMPLLDTTLEQSVMNVFISDIVLQILSFQAQQERDYIKQRQKEGIAAARAEGVHLGRPKIDLPSNFEELYKRFCAHESINSIAKDCSGMSAATLRTRLLERKKQDETI